MMEKGGDYKMEGISRNEECKTPRMYVIGGLDISG
jgi:hypothetical protein